MLNIRNNHTKIVNIFHIVRDLIYRDELKCRTDKLFNANKNTRLNFKHMICSPLTNIYRKNLTFKMSWNIARNMYMAHLKVNKTRYTNIQKVIWQQ